MSEDGSVKRSKGNIYFHPENYGLWVLAELKDSRCQFDFNSVVAWMHEDGTVYWQQDSGSSEPLPFDRFRELGSLNRAAPDLRDLIAAVDSHREHGRADADRFLSAVRNAMKRRETPKE
jgi:hypothetical protein